MTPTSPWTSSQLLAGLRGAHAERWKALDCRVVEVWQTWQSLFVRMSTETSSDTDLLFKIQIRESRVTPRQSYEEMVRLSSSPELAAVGVRIPEPIGWTSDPPAYCSAYIGGMDVSRCLESHMSPTGLVEQLARALAGYHAISRSHSVAAAQSRRAMQDLRRAARRVLSNVEVADIPIQAMSRFHSDFKPSNLRLDHQGGLWLLDPTAVDRFDFVHRDLAGLLVGIRMSLRRGNARWSILRERAVNAYASESGLPVNQGHDHRMLAIYETYACLKMTKHRFFERNIVASARLLSWAAQCRARI